MGYVILDGPIDPETQQPTEVRHEAPRKRDGSAAIGYLKPSGKQVPNALGHKEPGSDKARMEFVSDQRWIYDLAEAAELEKKEPARFVKIQS